MKSFSSIFLLLLCINGRSQDPLPAIGQWRDHLPYQSCIDLAASGGLLYAATPYSLFTVAGDNSIERYSRVNGLAETGISTIAADASTQKLLVAYQNSNIDILYRNDIINVPDIWRDNIAGDKTIYHTYPLNGIFYLSTGLGIILIDGSRYEVKDSWLIGSGGNPSRVNACCSDGSFFYAATEEGLKKIPVTGANPANYANWQLLSGNNGLPAGACQKVLNVQGKIILQKNDSLFVQNGSTWSFFYNDGWQFISSQTTEGKILLCETLAGNSRLQILNNDGSLFRSISNTATLMAPRNAILLNNQAWLADSLSGLSRFDAGGNPERYQLNSPASLTMGPMIFSNGQFYAAAGTVNNQWVGQQNRNGIAGLKEGQWTQYSKGAFDSLPDLISMAADKRDGSIWAGSFGGGLLQLQTGPVIRLFKQNNIGASVSDPNSYRVAGLAFDGDNNLWVSNFGAAAPLRVRKPDGNWLAFSPSFTIPQNALAQIVIGFNQFKWMLSPQGNGLICYDHGASIDNTGDDRWKKYSMGSGSGNLPSNEVLSVATDKNGFIWVGTNDGIGVIQCPDQAFAPGGCDAIWPVVPNGNFAGYLFKGQEVRSIAVDGADRKWVATRNGVFLVNAEGEKLIYRFTEANSPLLSNDVKQISIDQKSGEVFFATAKGICSFRSTATEGGTTNESVLVFPNPVPPGYTGTIAIRGLVNNAIVKITELDGRLVYQTRALGGQAIWDGRNYRGQKIASGAYLVLVSDDGSNSLSGKRERTAAKIFFISQ